MSVIEKALPAPDLYYDAITRQYYREDSSHRWISISETSAERTLRSMGYSRVIPDGAMISPVDEVLNKIQFSQNVAYASPLAGYEAGAYRINERLILVTDSPRLIPPVPGEWPVLKTVLEGMFDSGEIKQLPYFYGWTKVFLQALRQKRPQPGQMLGMAGDANSGKSLIQNIITELMGGRVAHPYSFMTDQTTFNGELFKAEHLAIEDDAELTDYRARRTFGSKIKQLVANRAQHCHGKYKEALTLTPFWRVTISLNDDPERLLVLPPLDDDIADKVILLKVNKREMPMPTNTGEEQEVFRAKISSELPAFVHFLDHWEIPAELRSPRFGIIHFHHPELVEGLRMSATENNLLEIIDTVIFRDSATVDSWTGSAASLQARLTDTQSRCREEARRLFGWPAACGTFLGRLERTTERVASRRVNGKTEWKIMALEELRAARPESFHPIQMQN